MNVTPKPRGNKRHILIALIVIGAGSALYAGSQRLFTSRMIGEEPAAAAYCKALAEAEEIYHRTDYTGNHVLKYAPTIQELYGKRGEVSLVGRNLAEAELGAGFRQPTIGYVFKVLTAQGPNAIGGRRSYLDQNGNMTLGYAFVAAPAKYGDTGVDTFIISHSGTIFQMNLGPNTQTIVEHMTEFNPPESMAMRPQ